MPNYVVVEVINERIQPVAKVIVGYDNVNQYVIDRGATGIAIHKDGYGIAVVNSSVKLLVFTSN